MKGDMYSLPTVSISTICSLFCDELTLLNEQNVLDSDQVNSLCLLLQEAWTQTTNTQAYFTEKMRERQVSLHLSDSSAKKVCDVLIALRFF
jgi:hypothetical protein